MALIPTSVVYARLNQALEVPIKIVVISTGIEVTGLTPANVDVTIWKPGMADFGNPDGGAATIGDEKSFGWYSYTTSAADNDTVGTYVLMADDLTNRGSTLVHVVAQYPPQGGQYNSPNG
jgi:hypothetical protein